MLSDNITRDEQNTLHFAERSVTALAEKYGTPLYLMDEERIRHNMRMYVRAFAENFAPGSLPLFASKAASFKAVYRIAEDEGMGVDCVSCGEIATALAADFPAEKIYFHGNCKTDADILYAVERNVGCFVVDNAEELLALERIAGERDKRQRVLLRLSPGIDPHTYAEVNTGMVDSKFGAAVETGQAMELVKLALRQPQRGGSACPQPEFLRSLPDGKRLRLRLFPEIPGQKLRSRKEAVNRHVHHLFVPFYGRERRNMSARPL